MKAIKTILGILFVVIISQNGMTQTTCETFDDKCFSYYGDYNLDDTLLYVLEGNIPVVMHSYLEGGVDKESIQGCGNGMLISNRSAEFVLDGSDAVIDFSLQSYFPVGSFFNFSNTQQLISINNSDPILLFDLLNTDVPSITEINGVVVSSILDESTQSHMTVSLSGVISSVIFYGASPELFYNDAAHGLFVSSICIDQDLVPQEFEYASLSDGFTNFSHLPQPYSTNSELLYNSATNFPALLNNTVTMSGVDNCPNIGYDFHAFNYLGDLKFDGCLKFEFQDASPKIISAGFGQFTTDSVGFFISINGSEVVDLSYLLLNPEELETGISLVYDQQEQELNLSGEIETFTLNLPKALRYIGVDEVDEMNLGCTDATASNYNFNATIDDGSCEYELSCTYFVTPWGDPDHPGVFMNQQLNVLFGDYSRVEIGVYGNFNNWNGGLGSANETFFAVNGGDMVSLAFIYNNMPYEIDGVTISVDNTSLSDNFPITDNWTSGTIIFEGQSIESVAMIQSESGYVNYCTESVTVSGDCYDYTLDNDDPDFPGQYGVGDVVLPYDGSQQQVELGVYGFFNNWDESGDYGQANQTMISVNGLGPVSLETIYNDMPYHMIGGAVIMIDPTLDNDNYLSESTMGWTASKLIIVGDISEIVMTQFESGLLYACTGYVTYLESDCEDYTDFDTNPYDVGIYQFEPFQLDFNGGEQSVLMGIYGFFNNWTSGDLGQADGMYISVNGADSVSLATIFENQPYNMEGITLTVSTNALDAAYFEGSSTDWTSGTLIIEGEIENVVVNLFESGIVNVCSEVAGSVCEYNTGGLFIYNSNSTGAPWQIRTIDDELVMQGESGGGTQQAIEVCLPDGCYKLCFDVIIEIFVDSAKIEMADGLVLMVSDVENQCYNFAVNSDCPDTDIYGCTDETAINYNPDATVDDESCEYGDCEYNSGQIRIYSTSSVIDDGVFSITNSLSEIIYSGIVEGGPSLDTLVYDFCLPDDCYEICFDPSDDFSAGFSMYWVDSPSENTSFNVQGDACYSFAINSNCDDSDIYGCTDETATNFNPEATIDDGSCEYETDCIDFPSLTGIPSEPGIYGGGLDTLFTYSGAQQLVSFGIYGQFINWDVNDPASLAQAMLVTVNGSDAVSIQTIVNNLPYVLNDITIDVDTNSLANDYDGLQFWTSGIISFQGEIESVGMHLDENGIVFACSQSMEVDNCGLETSFTYANISNYVSYQGTGLGSEFEWSFGDGTSSTLQNPSHVYAIPGDYNVCLTNSNLMDTCVAVVCQNVTVEVLNIDVNIITPDNDGINDAFPLPCNNVTIFNGNGVVVATWDGQEFWYGTDNAGVTLPMGQYFVQCDDTGLIVAVTIIW